MGLKSNQPEEGLTELVSKFSHLSAKFSAFVEKWREPIQSTLALIPELVNEGDKAWSRSMKEMAAGLQKLAGHGWYLSLDLPWNTGLTLAGDEEVDWALVDEGMGAIWEKESKACREHLISNHPDREGLLSQAFDAHEAGNYFLSVLGFLSIADGICLELCGVQLYSKINGGKETKLAKNFDSLTRLEVAFLLPLATVQPITFGPALRNESPGHLNRHEVLHGTDVRYGTKVNSLKAMSLMGYVTWVLQMIVNKEDPEDDAGSA